MLAHRLIHTAIAFFVLGVGLGIFMGARQDFRLMHVHAHVNLLGWVSLGLIGLLYMARPHLQLGWLPQAHFWLHTVGLTVFMGGFAMSRLGDTFHNLPVAGGASMLGLGVLLFAVHALRGLR
jgi:cbb3-type cytochrome oxidase subunit 1